LTKESEEPHFVIEPLGARHDRATFSCGNQQLDSYLQKQAGQDLKKRAAVPFIITSDHKTIAGFYTLSQYAVDLGELPEEVSKKMPRYPMVSATLLGRLAVSERFRRQGLGERLLMDALHRALQSSKQIASAAVVVDAKDDQAVAFYRKYGFIDLPKIEKRLFLPMGTIALLFSEDD
jgi:ribosomal protein S18 acetylase RimI-like enzyme